MSTFKTIEQFDAASKGPSELQTDIDATLKKIMLNASVPPGYVKDVETIVRCGLEMGALLGMKFAAGMLTTSFNQSIDELQKEITRL